MTEGVKLGRARIKTGAVIGQDHHCARWEDGGEVFDVYAFIESRHILTADGYGNLKKPNAYGNGSLFVKPEDLVWEAGT